MKYIMRFPLMPSFSAIAKDDKYFDVSYMEIDLHKLIENHDYIRSLIINFPNQDQITYYLLINITDWLYDSYKEIDHMVMAQLILDSFKSILSIANHKRMIQL